MLANTYKDCLLVNLGTCLAFHYIYSRGLPYFDIIFVMLFIFFLKYNLIYVWQEIFYISKNQDCLIDLVYY